MGRRLAIVAVLPWAALMATAPAAAAKLTKANSIELAFGDRSTDTFEGTGCATTDTVTHRLPAGARNIKVREPAVGDSAGGTRVSDVSVQGREVTITVVAEQSCEESWTADYDYEATYKRRVQSLLRIYYESYLFGAKWKLRPKTVHDQRKGASLGEHYTNLRWRSFGGKKAVGFGRLRQDYCRPSDNCPDQGGKVKLVASKPDYCLASGKVEYLALKGFWGGREQFAAKIDCTY